MRDEQLDLFSATDKDKHPIEIDPDVQRVHFLALSSIRGIGFHTLRKIYARYRRFDVAWDFSINELHQFISNQSLDTISSIVDKLNKQSQPILEKAQNSIETYRKRGIHLKFLFEQDFPRTFSNMPDPPYWIFIEGDTELLLRNDLVAVVGNRSASREGNDATRKISALLSNISVPIVSGLAEGIDAMAQQTAVDLGNKCVAILGTGISVVFPSATAGLREKIVHYGGTVITEYLPNDAYARSRFVQRNRLQAAISQIVIPVEWSPNSGTAHTIKFSEKYKKPVIFIRGLSSLADSDTNLYTSAQNRHILDIRSQSFGTDLISLLQVLGVDGSTKKSNIVTVDIFQTIVDDCERLLNSYDVSERDFNRFLDKIKNRWSKRQD